MLANVILKSKLKNKLLKVFFIKMYSYKRFVYSYNNIFFDLNSKVFVTFFFKNLKSRSKNKLKRVSVWKLYVYPSSSSAQSSFKVNK